MTESLNQLLVVVQGGVTCLLSGDIDAGKDALACAGALIAEILTDISERNY